MLREASQNMQMIPVSDMLSHRKDALDIICDSNGDCFLDVSALEEMFV